jgi:hypothetical protein
MSENVLEALRAAINSHDPERVAACFTDDFLSERPLRPHEGFTGNKTVLRNWTGILTRLPDLHAEILRHSRNGREIWSEWEMRGTNPAGGTTLLRGPVIVTSRDDLIAWARFYLDPVTLAEDTAITVSDVVAAPAARIFELLRHPDRHHEIDASGTVRHAETHRPVTALGDTFTMAMHHDQVGDYRTESHVVVFEPGRAIGWAPSEPGSAPLGQRFVWRLTPVDNDHTKVIQTYDWSAVTHPPAVAAMPVLSAEDLAGSLRLLAEVLA